MLETLDPLVDESITRINRWRTSGQKQRWHTAALPDIESHLRPTLAEQPARGLQVGDACLIKVL